jgi:hypothetical protein
VVDVVVEAIVVTVVVGAVVVVVGGSQGHPSVAGLPTATAKQTRASVAVVGSTPFGAHTQAAKAPQLRVPTATLRIARQSDAVGWLPPVRGWAQSPLAASALGAARAM